MIFRLDRFFFDEKDIFTFFFGVFILVAMYFRLSLEPFRSESLLVFFLFLLTTRTMTSSLRFEGYFIITLLGLVFSLFLSPYGVAVYLLVSMIVYLLTQRV